MLNKITIIFLISFLSSCNVIEETEIPGGQSAAYSSNAPSKWPNHSIFPLQLRISNDFDSSEQSAIGISADSWSSAISDRIDFFDTSSISDSEKSNINNYEDSILGVYKSYNWPSGLPATALAVTQIYGTRKNIGSSSERIEIYHADIIVNYEYYTFTTDGSWGYDLETVMVHELGHFLGLYHDNTTPTNTVMYPSISRYTQARAPKTNDISSIEAKYPASGASRSLASLSEDSSGSSEKVVIYFELYPNGKEIMRIKGEVNENKEHIIHFNCNHKH